MGVERVVEIPQIQTVEKVVEIPQLTSAPGATRYETIQAGTVRQTLPAQVQEVMEWGAPLPAEMGPSVVQQRPMVQTVAAPAVPVQSYAAPVQAVQTVAAPVAAVPTMGSVSLPIGMEVP